MRMKIHKLFNNNKKLIIFFSGWGMDYKPFEHINAPVGFDLIFLYDYNSNTFDISELYNYEEKYLISWSFGVRMATIFFNENTIFTKSIAINGTQYPINDELGIANNIFESTLFNLNKEKLIKFNRRMCYGNKNALDQLSENMPERTILSLKKELFFLKNIFFKNNNIKFVYSDVILSTNDKIFPFSNMLRYWEHQKLTKIHINNKPHYIFNEIKNWNEIIKLNE